MFAHLHVHSHYSFSDAPSAPRALARRAARLQMTALALTDHGVLHGVPELVVACRREGIRPLVGIELSFLPGGKDASATGSGTPPTRSKEPFPEKPFHLVLLCRDETGYRNLCRLSSAAQSCGMARASGEAGGGDREAGGGDRHAGAGRPLPVSVLRENAKGLVCLSGSDGGPLVRLLRAGQRDRAVHTARLLRELFPDTFFVELPATRAAGEDILRCLVDLARNEGIPVVVTADVHYAEPHEALTRRLLLAGRRAAARRTGETGAAPTRGEPGDLYLCCETEMVQRLAFLPSAVREAALAGTVSVAQQCQWDLAPLATAASPGAGDRLRCLVERGRRRRYPGGEPAEVGPRLARELEVILERGLADYFLLAHEVAAWCRREGIPVGPGRGSAASSLVCYCLEITDVDPLAEGLLFERFLNPERPDLPDIDMDVCQRRRPEVIAMLTRRSGTVGVVTFTTLGARAALRLVGKVLALPDAQVSAITAALPRERGPGALAHALDTIPELRHIPRDREPFRTLFGAASLLEGIPVGRSRHPAGVVAVPAGREDTLPLYLAPDGQPVSQYDAASLEMLGLPKLDVLGLRHLTVASDTVRMVQQVQPNFSLEHVDPRDPVTWDLVASGRTVGCFQLESEGMRRSLERARPRCLADLAIAIASYKPGPLRARRARPGRPAAPPPTCLEPILDLTGGILVYQEQVMEAGQRVAGMTPGEADLMRRALEKGERSPGGEGTEEWETRFVRGARERGIAEDEARAAFRWLRGAAGYTFNRAHAACYARLAYQAAYLKARHPAPYLAALLSNPGGYYPPGLYLYEARRLGIAVLPPHPNHSGAFWTVERETVEAPGREAIRAGLLSLPGVGYHAALACLRERAAGGEFTSTVDLSSRLKGKVPAAALSSLVAAWQEAEGPGRGRRVAPARPGDQAAQPGPVRDGREVVLEGRVIQGERIPAPGGRYRLVLLLDTGKEMVHVHVPAPVYERDALDIDPRHLMVRGRLERHGGHWRLLATVLGEKARGGDQDDLGGDGRLFLR